MYMYPCPTTSTRHVTQVTRGIPPAVPGAARETPARGHQDGSQRRRTVRWTRRGGRAPGPAPTAPKAPKV